MQVVLRLRTPVRCGRFKRWRFQFSRTRANRKNSNWIISLILSLSFSRYWPSFEFSFKKTIDRLTCKTRTVQSERLETQKWKYPDSSAQFPNRNIWPKKISRSLKWQRLERTRLKMFVWKRPFKKSYSSPITEISPQVEERQRERDSVLTNKERKKWKPRTPGWPSIR